MPRGGRAARCGRHAGARRVDAVLGVVRRARRSSTRPQCSPRTCPVISVEAGVTLGWERYADESIGIDTFGTSAPGDVALEFFGFTASAVASTVKEVLGG